MSPKTATIVAGLVAVLGWVASSRLAARVQDDPSPSAPAKAPAVPAPSPATAPGPPTVLLLTSGKVLQGEIQKTASGYGLKQKFGVIYYERRQVERMFRSLDEAYQYKLSLCPKDDADERLKLATWCVEQQMKPEAKEQLQATLELSPENRRARAMLASIDREALGSSTRDDGVVRTGAEAAVEPPGELTLNKLREEFARNPRAAGMPAIFDLEPPVAVRRYQDFARTVHPILQRRCARCHGEQAPGGFQLVQTRAERDLYNDLIVRSNLESALAIVNRDDLAHSALLSASGMTHGAGGKPVLGGPNAPDYKTLSRWVNSLRPGTSRPSETPASASASAATATPPEGFGTGRRRPAADPAMPPLGKAPSGEPNAAEPPPIGQFPPELRPENAEKYAPRSIPPAGSLLKGSGSGTPGQAPDDLDFPTPPLMGGSNPPKLDLPDRRPAGKPAPKAPADGPTIAMPDGSVVPAMAMPDGTLLPLVTPDMTKKGSPKAASGKKKVDHKALEQMLRGAHKGETVKVQTSPSGN